MLIKYINIPQDLWDGIYQTGSSVICNPPVTDTDIDYIIYTNKEYKLDIFLKSKGYIFQDLLSVEGHSEVINRNQGSHLANTFRKVWLALMRITSLFLRTDFHDRQIARDITIFSLYHLQYPKPPEGRVCSGLPQESAHGA